MITNPPKTSEMKNQHGASAVVVAIALITLLGFAALAIDVGYLYSTRNELQNIADGAALAATRQLGTEYQALSYQDQQTYVCNPATIVPVAQAVALKNQAAKVNIVINSADVIIGTWDGSTLTPTLNQPDAVGVIARRDSAANSPVTTFFAAVFKIFGGNLDTVAINADAIAALSGLGETDTSDLELPIGVDEDWFGDEPMNPYPDGYCGKQIKFSPTVDPEACGGWTSWTFGANDNNLRQILEGTLTSPPLGVGDPINFIGGDLSVPTFDDLLNLFKDRGYDVHQSALDADGNLISPGEAPMPADGTLDTPTTGPLPADNPNVRNLMDADGNPLYYPDGTTQRNAHVWITKIVVYESENCDNPNQSINIAGFATIVLTDVLGPPDKLVQGTILCDYVTPSNNRGGGGIYGTFGPIPGLVE